MTVALDQQTTDRIAAFIREMPDAPEPVAARPDPKSRSS